jgi:hypothetical protein
MFPSARTDDDTRLRKTAVHEIEHPFNMGEADDDCSENPMRNGEIYSGRPDDPTPEDIDPTGNSRWSVMSSGWSNNVILPQTQSNYFAYTIEELELRVPKLTYHVY